MLNHLTQNNPKKMKQIQYIIKNENEVVEDKE